MVAETSKVYFIDMVAEDSNDRMEIKIKRIGKKNNH